MNKSDLIQELADRANLTIVEARRTLDALFASDGIIPQALMRGQKVQITGFGSFETRHRPARAGRNPRTGEEIEIGPSSSAAFKAGKALKDAVAALGGTHGTGKGEYKAVYVTGMRAGGGPQDEEDEDDEGDDYGGPGEGEDEEVEEDEEYEGGTHGRGHGE